MGAHLTLHDSHSLLVTVCVLVPAPADEGIVDIRDRHDAAAQRKMKIPRLKGVDYDPDAPVVASAEQAKLLEDLPAVTDAMLKDPSPNDWLGWGRTYDGQNYS